METTAKRKRVYLCLSLLVALVVLVLMFWLNASRSRPPRYTVSELVDPSQIIPGVSLLSSAQALNDHGEVVGSRANGGADHAFFWSPRTGLVDIHQSTRPASLSIDINNKGQVLGVAYISAIGSMVDKTLFLWSETEGYRELPGIKADKPWFFSIDEEGKVVGRSEPDTVIINLTTDTPVVERILEIATYISNRNRDGCLVGSSTDTLTFFDNARTTVYNPAEINGHTPVPTELNDLGELVGTLWDEPPTESFRWSTAEGLIMLEGLGGEGTRARAINNAGVIVGAGDTVDWFSWFRQRGIHARWFPKWVRERVFLDGERHGVLWFGDDVFDLNDLIPPDSTVQIYSASDINEKGQIAAIGVRGYEEVAILLTPVELDERE